MMKIVKTLSEGQESNKSAICRADAPKLSRN